MISSQSVARMNDSWSNDVKRGPRAAGKASGSSGFAGRDDLEQTRRYRKESDGPRSGGYGMVFDVPDSGRRRKRSRSRERTRDRDTGRDQRPRRSRSPPSRREPERHRSHSRERRSRY